MSSGCWRWAPRVCYSVEPGCMQWRRRGEAGVTQLLDLISKEMRVAMTLTGAHNIAGITRKTWSASHGLNSGLANHCR